MTRETKIGMLMVLLLVGVFGFLVYKRSLRPGEGIAQADRADADDALDDGELSLTPDNESPADGQEPEPDILPVAAHARSIPQEDSSDEDDPFGAAETPRIAATPARTKLPTMIPDDDPPASDSRDEFGSEALTNVIEEAPTAVATSEPDIDGNDPFAGAVETGTVEDSEAVSPPATTVITPPAMDLETVEEEPPPRTPFPVRQPETRTVETFEDEEDATVSVQARAKLPEPSFDLDDEEPAPPEREPVRIPVKPAAPQLMLDDSDEEDRYGGYEPVEFGEESVSFGSAKSGGAKSKPTISITGDRHVVQAGENLWSISQKKYGTGRYFQALAVHNQSRIPDAGKLKPGVEVLLPPAEELERRYPSQLSRGGPAEPGAAASSPAGTPGEYLVGTDGRPMYRIGAGDTLSGIAQRYLGRARRWEQILEMNRDVLKDGNSLKLGAVLRLPNDAAQLQLSTQPRNFR